MSRISDQLRQTHKGKLVYDRHIFGRSLTDLLDKCSSPPLLSSTHTEQSPQGDSRRVILGLSFAEEGESCVTDDHDKEPGSCDGYEEKGKLDSFEREGSPSPKQYRKLPRLKVFEEKSINGQTRDNLHGASEKSISSINRYGQNHHDTPTQSPRSAGKVDTSGNLDSSIDAEHAELTVSFTEKLRIIKDVEDYWGNKVKDRLEKKQEEFLAHQAEVNWQREQGLSLVEQRSREDHQRQQQFVESSQLAKRQEIQAAIQKVKDSHLQCGQRQAARLREAERLGQQLRDQQIQREQALDQRVKDLHTMASSIAATKTTLLSTLDACPHQQHLSEAAEKTRLLVRKLAEQAEALASGADRSSPLDELTNKLKHIQQQGQNALDFVVSLTAEAEKKAKAEAEKQQAPQPQTQAQAPSTPQAGQAASSQPPVSPSQDSALTAVTRVYADNVKLLADTEAALQPFVGDQQMKKIRFDLQRAVNTPVNAISAVNSSHLRDKFTRLRALLRGETVEVVGKQVSARQAPQGLTFCKNLVAKMIARKADEQVSSNHDSAFGVAAVAVGLWSEFPVVGQLLTAHLQAACPYTVPFYPPRLEGQSSADYHRTLGYKVEEDGTIEAQDKFLRRMSGLMRLYAAIMVTSPPPGSGGASGGAGGHPHGLDRAWAWLSKILNLEPNPDITATAIYDVLQVTGHYLLKAYRVQFVKLVYCLYKALLPKLKAVAAGSGPVIRLETFLETTLKNSCLIPEPDGYIHPRFWNF